MIHFACPHCHQSLKVEDNAAGKKTKCPKCGAVIAVPLPSSPDEQIDGLVSQWVKPKAPTVEDAETFRPGDDLSHARQHVQKANASGAHKTFHLVCPTCKAQSPFEIETPGFDLTLHCPACKATFLSHIVTVRTKRGRNDDFRRHFSVRVTDFNGNERMIDFWKVGEGDIGGGKGGGERGEGKGGEGGRGTGALIGDLCERLLVPDAWLVHFPGHEVPKKYPISRQPSSNASDERAAVGSS